MVTIVDNVRNDEETVRFLFHQTFEESPTIIGRGRTSLSGTMKRISIEIDPEILDTCKSVMSEAAKASKLPDAVVVRKSFEFFLNSVKLLNQRKVVENA